MNYNYYELLDVKPNATTDEIRAAYRKLAKHYHPDTSQVPNAQLMFRLIADAHDVLTDTSKRERYDYELNFPKGSSAQQPRTNHDEQPRKTNGKSSYTNTNNSKTKRTKSIFSQLSGNKVVRLILKITLYLVATLLNILFRALEFLLHLSKGITRLAGGFFILFSVLALFMSPPDYDLKTKIFFAGTLLAIGGLFLYLSEDGYDAILEKLAEFISNLYSFIRYDLS